MPSFCTTSKVMSDTLFQKRNLRVLPLGRNLEDLLPILAKFPVQLVADKPDLIIAHGGDGTLLGAERDYPLVPKCALRDRRRNPKCPLHDEEAILRKLFAGELDRHSLLILRAETQTGETLTGINDLVLSRINNPCSAIRYRVWQDGKLLLPQTVSDSLIISTPFGSTGYFQSVTRGVFRCGLGLACNNAMDGIGFAIVPETATLTIRLLRGPAVLAADNNPQLLPLGDDCEIRVTVAPDSTPVYGLEAFRCHDCYLLRRNGIPEQIPTSEVK
jgi:NAD+ kinase